MGLIYGIFSKGTSIDEYSIGHILGVSIGFMITSFIFAAIIYLILMIFMVSNKSEIEQSNDKILDAEYTKTEKQQTTNLEQFTKYWLIVGIVMFILMSLNNVVQSS